MNATSSISQTQRPLAATRWRLDPSASTPEFKVPHFWGLVEVGEIAANSVRAEGVLETAGERLALTLESRFHQTNDHLLEVDVTTTVDQRQLGMTWSPLGMTRSPVTLTVHASLRRQS